MTKAGQTKRADASVQGQWSSGYTFLLLALSFFIGLCAWGLPELGHIRHAVPDKIGEYRLAAWLVVLLLFTLFTTVVGKGITGLWRGVFIDPRNQISLSRMQTALWTVLVLSSWITAVLSNYAVGKVAAPGPKPSPVVPLAERPAAAHLNGIDLKVDPIAAAPGDLVSLYGNNFGDDHTAGKSITFDGSPAPLDATFNGHKGQAELRWTNQRIDFRIPDKAPNGSDWAMNQQVDIGVSGLNSKVVKAPLAVISPALPSVSSALDVAIPVELWVALGISLVSLVGSPLILNSKRSGLPDPVQRDETINQLGREKIKEPENNVPPDGLLITKRWPQDAQFSDLFRGEETGNGAHLDLAKVQMFFFTLALVLAYAVAVGALFLDSQDTLLGSLPALSAGFVTLLGISHAGYLTSKALPHSKEADRDDTASLTPAEGPVGTVVTLHGSGFGTGQGGKQLLINSIPLHPEYLRAWTDDQIQFVIPPHRSPESQSGAAGGEQARIGLQGAVLTTPNGTGELTFAVTPLLISSPPASGASKAPEAADATVPAGTKFGSARLAPGKSRTLASAPPAASKKKNSIGPPLAAGANPGNEPPIEEQATGDQENGGDSEAVEGTDALLPGDGEPCGEGTRPPGRGE
jgi:hypothetical protein